MSPSGPALAETKSLLAGMAAEAADLRQAVGGSVTDTVAGWLAAQYASAAQQKLAGADGARRWDILHAFVQDWSLLRRGDHSAARLQLDREQFDWLRASGQAAKEKEFHEWLMRPEIRKKLDPNYRPGLTAETRELIERELNLL